MNSIPYREHRERLKRTKRISIMRRVAFATMGGLFIFGALYFLLNPIHHDGIRGTIIESPTRANGKSPRRYWTIRLDGGAMVKAKAIGTAPYRTGHRVMLRETSTKFFGYKWYQIKALVEDSSNPSSQDKP